MDLILHIGTEKTGTTSFQWWGGENRDALRDRGIWYDRSLGRHNHQRLYLWALDRHGLDDGFARMGITDQNKFQDMQAQVPRDLAAEVAEAKAADCHTFVLSCEHCHSRLIHPHQVQKLHALLAPLFQRIEVICALRPQIDMGISLFSTAARGWLPVRSNMLNQIRPANAYYNFETLNGRWAAVFGSENIRYLAYARGQNVIDEMTSRFNLDPTILKSPTRTNPALDVRTFGVVNVLATLPKPRQDALKPVLNPLLETLPYETPLRPSVEQAKVVQDRFTELNARVIDRHHDLSPGDLDPDWSRYPDAGNFEMLDHGAAYDEQTAMLLFSMARQNTLTELRRAASDAELAIAANQPERLTELSQTIDRLCARLSGLEGACPDPLTERIARIKAAVQA